MLSAIRRGQHAGGGINIRADNARRPPEGLASQLRAKPDGLLDEIRPYRQCRLSASQAKPTVVVKTDPDGTHEARCVADKPAVAIGCSGLSSSSPLYAHPSGLGGGSRVDHRLHAAGDQVSDLW